MTAARPLGGDQLAGDEPAPSRRHRPAPSRCGSGVLLDLEPPAAGLRSRRHRRAARRPAVRFGLRRRRLGLQWIALMGSLIKKRRKRMRKKKHKKMLKRTRWQRRAGK